MLLAGVETLPLEAVLAHYRAFGWARLGPIAAPAALEALGRRAEQLMLGEVVHPGLFFQHDSDSGTYGDVPRRQGWQGPSLRYRKLEKLERDPIFAAFIGNPLFARIAHAVIGPDVVTLPRGALHEGRAGRHRATLAPGRRIVLGAQPRPRAANLDRARRRARRFGLRGAGSGVAPHGPRHAARRRHPR